MAVTPLIKPITTNKGIFYSFQSALEDINITLANGSNSVRFSKFALLRIPNFAEPNNLKYDNRFQLSAIGESSLIEGLHSDLNIDLAESFQNYALNLESLIISMDSYNREAKLTVAERVFWKWLKESGSINFRYANDLEKNVNILGDTPRFVETYIPGKTYDPVVKYLGDIDVVNTVKSIHNSYTEIYIHVPTNVGTTPHILFKSVKDENYYPNMIITNKNADPLDVEYLAGRHYNDSHPYGLSLKAFYDLDDGSVYTEITDDLSNPFQPGKWFNYNINNAYYTDSIDNEFNIPKEEWISKTKGS